MVQPFLKGWRKQKGKRSASGAFNERTNKTKAWRMTWQELWIGLNGVREIASSSALQNVRGVGAERFLGRKYYKEKYSIDSPFCGNDS
jgi:hypothetical protein